MPHVYNLGDAMDFEKKRRGIANAGKLLPMKGPLAHFGANLAQNLAPEPLAKVKTMQAHLQESHRGYNYSQEQMQYYDEKKLKETGKLRTDDQAVVMKNVAAGIKVAEKYDKELRQLGEYIAFKTGQTWIHGPIKLVGGTGPKDRGAYMKTVKDNFLNWSLNKDYMRGTVACQTPEDVTRVSSHIYKVCCLEYGMKLVKDKERKAAEDPCGYSDWNFAVIMKGCSIPGEIQVNTWALMYAKMSKSDFIQALLGGNAAAYTSKERTMGFEGGLQHLFYEIYGLRGEDGEAAGKLSKAYCDLARMNDGERMAAAPGITERINQFDTVLKTPKALEIWSHRPAPAIPFYGTARVSPAAERRPSAPVFGIR